MPPTRQKQLSESMISESDLSTLSQYLLNSYHNGTSAMLLRQVNCSHSRSPLRLHPMGIVSGPSPYRVVCFRGQDRSHEKSDCSLIIFVTDVKFKHLPSVYQRSGNQSVKYDSVAYFSLALRVLSYPSSSRD